MVEHHKRCLFVCQFVPRQFSCPLGEKSYHSRCWWVCKRSIYVQPLKSGFVGLIEKQHFWGRFERNWVKQMTSNDVFSARRLFLPCFRVSSSSVSSICFAQSSCWCTIQSCLPTQEYKILTGLSIVTGSNFKLGLRTMCYQQTLSPIQELQFS